MKSKLKTAKVIRLYTLNAFGYEITVPVSAVVSNSTACGYDDSYRFWCNFHAEAKRLSGFNNSILLHDLTHYGVNVPADYCEPYSETA